MAAFETEFENALVDVVDDDATLFGLVSTILVEVESEDILKVRFLKDRPFEGADWPQLTYKYRVESPQNLNRRGRVDIDLEIDLWGADADLAAIEDALRSLLDERERLAAGESAIPISMTNWECKHFRWLRSNSIPTNIFTGANHVEIVQRATEWTVRLYRKGA